MIRPIAYSFLCGLVVMAPHLPLRFAVGYVAGLVMVIGWLLWRRDAR